MLIKQKIQEFNLHGVIVFFIFIPCWGFSQVISDTILIKAFEIIDTKVSVEAPYKKQELDSATLNYYTNNKLSEVLENETPVFVKTYGSGSLATLSIRGTGASHTQLFWNGISITSPILGLNDFALLSVSSFDQAEIHYGLSSLEDGSGGLGGSLQLNNSANWKNKLKTSVNLQAGSFSNYSNSLRIDIGNDKIQSQTGFTLNSAANNFSYTNTAVEGNPVEKQENAALFQYSLFQNIFYKKNNSTTFSLKNNYNYSHRNLPKTVTVLQSNQNLKDNSFRSIAEWDRIKTKSLLAIKMAYLFEQLNYTDSLSNIFSQFQIHSLRSQLKYKYDLRGWLIQATANFDVDRAYSSNYATKITQWKNSEMISIKRKIGNKLLLHSLLREDVISGTNSPIQPSFGANLEILKGLNWKINTGRSYRYPSLNELYWNGDGSKGNVNLKPESGWNIESGVLVDKTVKKMIDLSVEITAFYSKINNWILWSPSATSSTFWTPENKRKVENKGVEFSFMGKYKLKKIYLIANAHYTYTSSKNLATSKQLIYVPLHSFKMTSLLLYKNVETRFNYSFTDRRFITTDNNWYMPNYELASFSLGKQFTWNKNNLLIRFSILNMLNTQYQSIAWRPMPSRNYKITIRYTFTK